MGDRRDQELDHQPRDRRLLRRVRGHRPRGRPLARDHRVRGRGRPARLQRRQARAQDGHPRLTDRPADLRRRPRSARRTSSARSTRASRWRWARWTSRASAPAPRRSGSPRARPTTPPPTPASAASSASRSTPSRRSSSSWPTWRRSARRRASCSTRRARRSTAATPTVGKYTAMAKLFCSDVAMKVTVEAVQVLGGYGYVKEYPGRADDARRQDHPDLRGHERDPAPRDRPHAEVAPCHVRRRPRRSAASCCRRRRR